MKALNNYSKFVPYLYFIAVTAYWFTSVNKSEGINAYPILLFGIPFLWQLIKPSKKLNFNLGITFVCLSSYLILAYISDVLDIVTLKESTKQFLLFGGFFVFSNFIMAVWIIKNSLKRAF